MNESIKGLYWRNFERIYKHEGLLKRQGSIVWISPLTIHFTDQRVMLISETCV